MNCEQTHIAMRGGALAQFLIALPLVFSLSYYSLRHSVDISTLPGVSHGMRTVLESVPISSYRYTENLLRVEPTIVDHNVQALVQLGPTGPRASIILALAERAHGLGFAAFRCDCQRGCHTAISQREVDRGIPPQLAIELNGLQSQCNREFADTMNSADLSADGTCAVLGREERVCYAGLARFTTGFSTQVAREVHIERARDSRLPALGGN